MIEILQVIKGGIMLKEKHLIKRLAMSCCAFVMIIHTLGWASSVDNSNTVIIKSDQNVVSGTVLVPSSAKKLRTLRERQEIQTEDSILTELEKQRLLDEQKRSDRLFGKSKSEQAPAKVAPSARENSYKSFLFENKAFISLGAGFVNYISVKNVNSTETPSLFLSFGAYGYGGRMIFDLSTYYSTHYLRTPNQNYDFLRERLDEPAMAMAIKYSFVGGRAKPYVGVTGVLIGRKWSFVQKDGRPLASNPKLAALRKDVALKEWQLSFNAGGAVGADVALGDKLGLNVDARYYVNLYTENRTKSSGYLSNVKILDKRDFILVSASLRYYL